VTTPPTSADDDAPVTTIVRTPASPGGNQGWDVAPVQLSVWATDGPDGSRVAHTRCVLDPASEPVRFADLPAACPYLGAGLDVSSDGHHVLYAASIDPAGNAEAPKRVDVKIDTTPPTVTCDATPTALWPRNHKLVDVHTEVSVRDALSGAAGFTLQAVTSSQPDKAQPGDRPGDIADWTVGTADADGRLRAETRGSDRRVYRVLQQGADRAGNTAVCAMRVTVPARS
jgi:hypothetical protein